jgi:cytochrome c peroxidase
MKLLFLLPAASAFTPSSLKAGQRPLVVLNNWGKSNWSPSGGGGGGRNVMSNFQPVSSTPTAAAPTSSGKSYARSKWSPSGGGDRGGNGMSTFQSVTSTSMYGGAAASSFDGYDDVRAELKVRWSLLFLLRCSFWHLMQSIQQHLTQTAMFVAMKSTAAHHHTPQQSLMDNPSWDDGSLAPIFIRLAWHSSGTYDAASNTGGSNGAGMRFATEAADPENAGLEVARSFLEPVKAKFPQISYSDLWILAAYVGLEHTGGPMIEFHSGRVDHVDESYWQEKEMTYGRLPAAEKYCCPHLDDSNVASSMDPETGTVKGWEGLCTHVRNEVFYRMGFNDQEIVALLCGGHVYGRCHPNFSGYAGPWVEHPTQFSNEYAADMIEDDWTLVSHGDTWLDTMGAGELRPAPGKRQFVNKVRGKIDNEPNQMMLLSDMILAWDPAFRQYLEVYAEDEDRLKSDFGAAFKKLTELGCGF